MADVIFADGLIWRPKKDSAPDFVVGSIAVKVSDAIETLKKHEKNGWVNMNVKKGRSGNFYVEIDTWLPDKSQNNVETDEQESSEETEDQNQISEDTQEGQIPDIEDNDLPF